MKKIILNSGWTLCGGEYENISATVPGCVHTDLKDNGLIPDYFYGKNNDKCDFIEKTDWAYTTVFDFDCVGEYAELVFDGLDTYATIELNGEVIGQTQNMFTPYRYNVSDKLKAKKNTLKVKFRSPVNEVAGREKLTGAFTTERLHTRRIQCTYLWDWVARFVTCGIYRPVYLVVGKEFEVDNVYVYTSSIDDFGAEVVVTTNYKNYEKSAVVKTEIISPDGKVVYSNSQYVNQPSVTVRVNIENPQLWWPNGYGDHPLYTLKITAGDNEFTQLFGVRTVRVAEIFDRDNDYNKTAKEIQERLKTLTVPASFDRTEQTAGFVVLVNGKRIFCRGGNWVPCEPFPSSETVDKIKNILQISALGGMNMVRVWGGGIAERDEFYDECDRLGILVTQDFFMACGVYPAKERWFLDELNREAEYTCLRLRNHPCLAWWSGDNENATRGEDLLPDFNGRTASIFGLEPIISKNDYSRRYHLSSPYGGTPYMSVTRGTTHTTNFFGELFDYFINTDCAGYKEHLEKILARFTVEEPVFGMATKRSLLRFMDESDLADESEEVLYYHCKTNPGLEILLYDYGKAFAQKALGGFDDTDDKLFKYSYIQYEWIRVVAENYRRNIGYSDGLVFWMLNDCWPASMGWSLIDYYNLPKPAYYAVARLGKKFIGSIKKSGGQYDLFVSSDGDSGSGVAKVLNRSGKTIKEVKVKVDGYSAVKIPLGKIDEDFIICDIEVNGVTDRCFYRDGILPLKRTDGVIVTKRDEDTISIKADRYIHAVELDGDFVFSDNYFSLLPGEEKTVSITPTLYAETDEITVNGYTVKN
ncbi:MAG: hypothetical protein IJY70_02895 [Clostridia bacterium]|nr:hypothetical protein [Clostridia bacterium]